MFVMSQVAPKVVGETVIGLTIIMSKVIHDNQTQNSAAEISFTKKLSPQRKTQISKNLPGPAWLTKYKQKKGNNLSIQSLFYGEKITTCANSLSKKLILVIRQLLYNPFQASEPTKITVNRLDFTNKKYEYNSRLNNLYYIKTFINTTGNNLLL